MVRTTVMLPIEMHEELRSKAFAKGISMGKAIREALKEWLERRAGR